MKKGLSRLLWIPALALLAAVLVLVNRPAPAAPAPAPQESLPEDDPAIPLGTQVGSVCRISLWSAWTAASSPCRSSGARWW